MKHNSAKDIVHHLYDLFLEIHDQWPDKGTEAYARQMLEHDILLLGSYFGSVDPMGQHAEFTLLAECIAHIRVMNAPPKIAKNIESWIERIMEEFKGQAEEYRLPVASHNAAEMIAQMKTITLTADLEEMHAITEDQKKALHDGFIALANVFLMRDGIVTDKELAAITAFETLLKNATSF